VKRKKKTTYEYGVEKIKLHKNTNLKLGLYRRKDLADLFVLEYLCRPERSIVLTF
jgi:hypothetical protein